mmetsp:Transcript_9805/g.15757  ORF Transcript_9805/g.15757 Transcript_9805/m.15757 type:complete len:92 (-) Transcript_9805:493-768(-)
MLVIVGLSPVYHDILRDLRASLPVKVPYGDVQNPPLVPPEEKALDPPHTRAEGGRVRLGEVYDGVQPRLNELVCFLNEEGPPLQQRQGVFR